MLLLIGLMCGLLAGYHIRKYFELRETANKLVGNLRIDKSDPYDGPYMFLELETDPKNVEKMEHVLLKVINENYISQK